MSATATKEPDELAPTTPWQDRPLAELPCKLPTRTREMLVNRGIDTLGKLAEAIDDARDIGLGDLSERVLIAIQSVREAEDEEEDDDEEETEATAMHVPTGAGGDGAAMPVGGDVRRVIESIPSRNGHHANGTGEKIAKGELPDFDEARAKIIEANEACDEAEKVFLVANERAKEAKKEFESAKANLRKTVSWANTPIVPPKPDLFTGVKEATTQEIVDTLRAGGIDAVSKEVEDCWRKFPLARFEQFDLPAGVIQTLAEQGISTVGELADFTAPNANGYSKRLNDLKGIGPGKITKIEEATTAFWQFWPNHRDTFAAELGLIAAEGATDGNATTAGTGSEGSGDGVEGNPSEEPTPADADAPGEPSGPRIFEAGNPNPEPAHAGGKRKRGKKK